MQSATSSNSAHKPALRGFLQRNLRIGATRDFRLAGWMLLAIASMFLAYIARMNEVTHDVFHEMSLFREALLTKELPQQDVFAYTPTVSPSVHHEWATGAVLYSVTLGTGLGVLGLTVLKFLLAAAMWLVLYRVARMRGAHPYIFAILSLAVFPVMWVGFATVRAQQFTLLFIALQLWMQELDWRGRRAWIVLWLLMLVAWLNLHAGFVVGIGLIAFHSLERFFGVWLRHRSLPAACKATWHLMLAAPLAVLCLRLNPYGWEYIPYLIRAISMPRPLIREWQPLWQTYMPLLTVSVFLISLGLYVYAQRHVRFSRSRGAAFLALCSYMAIRHIRHGSIYGVVWIAYVPAWISHTPLGRSLIPCIDRHRQLAMRTSKTIAAVGVIYACAHQFWMPSMPPRRVYSTACYPTGAVEYLKQNNFCGNLVTPFHVGSYVSWEMYPQVKVSLDGRYEVAYQEHVMPEHNLFFGAIDDWWTFLEAYPTDAVLVHVQAPVVEKLQILGKDHCDLDRPGLAEYWEVVYRDDSFVILAAEHCRLPSVDRTHQPLSDGAHQAFSAEHAHWNWQPAPTFAQR